MVLTISSAGTMHHRQHRQRLGVGLRTPTGYANTVAAGTAAAAGLGMPTK